jgi:serine/threonine protein kinase
MYIYVYIHIYIYLYIMYVGMRASVYDNYEIGEVIGRGKFGTVHRGHPREGGEEVAIKCMRGVGSVEYNVIAKEVLMLNKVYFY